MADVSLEGNAHASSDMVVGPVEPDPDEEGDDIED